MSSVADGDEEAVLLAGVVDQQVLELLVAQELHGAGEVAAAGGRAAALAKAATSPSGMYGEQVAGLAGHLLVDPLEPLDQAADVVVAVAVVPDVLDDLGDRAGRADRRLGGDGGRLPEVLQERAVEAVEDGEVRLVRDTSRPCGCRGRASARRGCGTSPGRRKTMNSRSGMSTPVDSRSTVTTMPGFGRLRNSRMRCSGRSTRPVIFWTKASPRPKTSRQMSTSWSAWEVCGRSLAAKIRVLGKRPYCCSCSRQWSLRASRILRLESGEVTVALDLGGLELPLVLQQVELLGRRCPGR